MGGMDLKYVHQIHNIVTGNGKDCAQINAKYTALNNSTCRYKYLQSSNK